MKLVRMSIAIALAVAPSFAHAKAAPDKQAPAEVTPNEAREWLALFDKVVDAVVVNKDDCTKMAGTINAVVDANQPTIEMAKDAKAKGKKLPASAQQHMLDGARRMIGSLDKCGHDDAVSAAFKRIDLGGRK
ncbi:MAG: hypothetical protein HOV81_24980 [Kofleriaceae bacterium]|nr:hypothetical protein [Kofleriaceae bacterium]